VPAGASRCSRREGDRRPQALGDEKVRHDRQAGARGAHPPDRRERGRQGSVIVEKVKSETAPNRGYDAESMEYVDMLQRHHRPDQGRTGRAAERGVGRVAAAHQPRL